MAKYFKIDQNFVHAAPNISSHNFILSSIF